MFLICLYEKNIYIYIFSVLNKKFYLLIIKQKYFEPANRVRRSENTHESQSNSRASLLLYKDLNCFI